MINELCLDAGVQELPGIDQFKKPRNITYLGLIRDIENPMASQVCRVTKMISEMFR